MQKQRWLAGRLWLRALIALLQHCNWQYCYTAHASIRTLSAPWDRLSNGFQKWTESYLR